MSAVLSEAETKFFSSRGQDVDASLRPAAAPNEPAANGGDVPATVAPAQSTPVANGGEQPTAAATGAEITQPTQQHVPLAALHEERKARQRAEQDRQQLAQQVQQFQQQLEQLQKAQQPPPPDPNQNPFEWLMHQGQLTQQELTQLKEWRAQQEQQNQHQAARQQFHQAISSSEQSFAAKQPDYYQAAQYAMQQYDRTLRTLIPDAAERRQRVVQEAMNVAWTVMQKGQDPAQFFYQYAKDMGYTGPITATIQAAAPGAPQTVPEVVQTIERGLKQRANSGGGGAPASEPTPEMALKMSPDDFKKWWAKQFRR